MKNNEILAVLGAFMLTLGLLVIAPALGVLFGWLGGFLVELVLGSKPTEWLNLTFNTDRFTKGDLPKITAVLAIIGSYFRTKVTTNSE